MLTTAKLFQLLNEAIVLLLGALLILLAVSGRVGLPTRPAALIALGVVFIYWGARAWIRPEPSSTRWAREDTRRFTRTGRSLCSGHPDLALTFRPVASGPYRGRAGLTRDSRRRATCSK